MSGRALIAGVTGISGGNLAARLLDDGWDVAGLSRRPDGIDERITPLAADLEDAETVANSVRGSAPTHVAALNTRARNVWNPAVARASAPSTSISRPTPSTCAS